MKRAIRLLFGIISLVVSAIFFFVLFSQNVNAAAPTISNAPSSINTDSEFVLSASMDGLSKSTIYRMRIVFGSSNYFGSTYNGSSWYNGTPSPINYANFLSITTDDTGAWSGEIKGKVENSDPNFTTGTNTYDVKVGRYTENGTSATWSNTVQILVNAPPPTATPTVTPTNTPTPQNTPTPTKTPTPTPTGKAASSSSPTPDPTATGILKKLSPTKVLGLSTKSAVLRLSSPTPVKKPSPTVVVQGIQTKFDFVPVLFIGGGILLLLACGILTFRSQLERLWKRE